MNVAVLVPSYRRPWVLSISLPSWLKDDSVRYLIVVADSPFEEEINFYKKVLAGIEERYNNVKIVYRLYKGRSGSINARNKLLELASELNVEFAVMVDNDMFFPIRSS